MNRSTRAVEKKNSSWAWLFQVYSTLFPSDPPLVVPNTTNTETLPKKSLRYHLSEDNVREILSYMCLADLVNLLSLTKEKQHSFFYKNVHAKLEEELLSNRFIYLMKPAILNKEVKARAMLEKYPELTEKLITTPTNMHGELARQFSNRMYAYEYAWFVDDKVIRQVLEKGMKDELKDTMSRQCEAHVMDKFIYLLTREGQSNISKARAMLDNYPHLVSSMIATQVDLRDTVRHFIKPMSAYEYAFWSGATHMRLMLNEYVKQDQKLKSTVYEQCKNINEHGLAFEMITPGGKTIPKSTVSNSKHFDYQPLIEAYTTFKERGGENCWLNIGKEWAKAPIPAMQYMHLHTSTNYETTLDFNLSDTFHGETVHFNNWQLKKEQNLVSLGSVNPDLGRTFSIIREIWPASNSTPDYLCFYLSGLSREVRKDYIADDLHLVQSISRVRTGDDLQQTLVFLQPAEPSARLSV